MNKSGKGKNATAAKKANMTTMDTGTNMNRDETKRILDKC